MRGEAIADGPLPFLFVQLANYGRVPESSEWPELRESQTAALGLRNTGMAVTIDVGAPTDIHPRNKQDVGTRLALAARAIAYGDDQLVYSGPIFRQMTTENGNLRLWFDHVGSGLRLRDGAKGFQVAGPDGVFHAAILIGHIDRFPTGHQSFHSTVGRDYGAVTAAAKEIADFTPRGTRILASQPHGKHSWLAQRA